MRVWLLLLGKKSLEELRKEYPKIFEQYDIEKLKLENILKLKQKNKTKKIQGVLFKAGEMIIML